MLINEGANDNDVSKEFNDLLSALREAERFNWASGLDERAEGCA